MSMPIYEDSTHNWYNQHRKKLALESITGTIER